MGAAVSYLMTLSDAKIILRRWNTKWV